MPVIGKFSSTRDGYAGRIRTLTINTRVRIIANDKRSKEGAPDFRVIANDIEIGAAWRQTRPGSDMTYLRVRLDDPALPAPVWGALMEQSDDGVIRLIWRRDRREAE